MSPGEIAYLALVIAGFVLFAGSLGWYDYAFARPELCIPRLFY